MPKYIINFEIIMATQPNDVKRLIHKCRTKIKKLRKEIKRCENKRIRNQLRLQIKIIQIDIEDYKHDLDVMAQV